MLTLRLGLGLVREQVGGETLDLVARPQRQFGHALDQAIDRLGRDGLCRRVCLPAGGRVVGCFDDVMLQRLDGGAQHELVREPVAAVWVTIQESSWGSCPFWQRRKLSKLSNVGKCVPEGAGLSGAHDRPGRQQGKAPRPDSCRCYVTGR